MNHPTREEWMSFIYDEMNAQERVTLATHLQDCAGCAAQVKQWQSATTELDAWQFRPARRETRSHAAVTRPLIQWAAAAVILLVASFVFGRLGAASVGKNLRVAIEPEIRRQLGQEFEAKRVEDARAFYAALEKLDAQRIADYVSLKKELDTVAVLTDVGLRNTEQELAQLADNSRAADLPGVPSKRIR